MQKGRVNAEQEVKLANQKLQLPKFVAKTQKEAKWAQQKLKAKMCKYWLVIEKQ